MSRILALALAACGPRHAAPVPNGPPYRALFERGASWSLPVVAIDGHFDGLRYVADKAERGTLQCRVADVTVLESARIATVRCAAPYTDLLIVGPWVGTRVGLFHPAIAPNSPEDLAAYSSEDAHVAETPADHVR